EFSAKDNVVLYNLTKPYHIIHCPVDGMSEVKEGPFEGNFWEEPSSKQLRLLLWSIFSNPVEAKLKGIQARLDMVSKFSPAVVAKKGLGSTFADLQTRSRKHILKALLSIYLFSIFI
ncbi:hypothetical protein KI387_014212, partial [Taxus chinensis]